MFQSVFLTVKLSGHSLLTVTISLESQDDLRKESIYCQYKQKVIKPQINSISSVILKHLHHFIFSYPKFILSVFRHAFNRAARGNALWQAPVQSPRLGFYINVESYKHGIHAVMTKEKDEHNSEC